MPNMKMKIIPLLEVDIIIDETPDTFMGAITTEIVYEVTLT